mmetsp:Transcript_36692/g.80430  ORF Transcript_36692/g.80430 Transcript_36692/m.80430 type:complete len:244 (+) Transcript_36692:100-831(+)|eukprot:CAMPEP_0170635138 /NCGR_PEP_ID=MMETSP0224-20130122/37040_1 /TAXON_ID=285029 /ORGANISM="Togula jolla, Strain CCCM 725" /LENGTH=243 /DNA_ID=CAMNT_0010964575 /DNA_START=32 /DNA_END=763 /DNA_ORIENTATION=+
MADAVEQPRERSRSPRGSCSSDAPQVPAHWLSPATGAAPEAESRKGKGERKGACKDAAGDGSSSTKEEQSSADSEISAVSLLVAAGRIEGCTAAELDPLYLARLLRKTAARLSSLEKNSEEMGQALRAVCALSGRTLQGLGLGGNEGEAWQLPELAGTKSFLVKKGDAEIQEAMRAAAQQKPAVVASGGAAGGALDPGARNNWLGRLETVQAERHKERIDAAAKARAYEALFARSSQSTSGKL